MTDRHRMTWREVEHLTPEQRQWLLRLCDAAANDCKSRQAAAKYIGVTLDELDQWLYFLSCRLTWPPRFDSGVFQKPVRDAKQKVAKEASWIDELLSVEESDDLRREVMAWMRENRVPLNGLSTLVLANARKVFTFLQGDTCDRFVANALRATIHKKKRGPMQWDPSRANDAAALREQRERELLELERVKYGLTKQRKPLSKMPV